MLAGTSFPRPLIYRCFRHLQMQLGRRTLVSTLERVRCSVALNKSFCALEKIFEHWKLSSRKKPSEVLLQLVALKLVSIPLSECWSPRRCKDAYVHISRI
jgi:hypothetical protein